jgi:small subunit ribosomal protein S1
MNWQEFFGSHQPGDVVEGVVVKVVPFGSFVDVDGVTGLAYQQTWPEGERVRVRILALDDGKQRFSLAEA